MGHFRKSGLLDPEAVTTVEPQQQLQFLSNIQPGFIVSAIFLVPFIEASLVMVWIAISEVDLFELVRSAVETIGYWFLFFIAVCALALLAGLS
jgi:hypothetical protein